MHALKQENEKLAKDFELSLAELQASKVELEEVKKFIEEAQSE